MSGNTLGMTAEEAIAYLQHSDLPTVLVEGNSDRAILRKVEANLQNHTIDILPIGGKDLTCSGNFGRT